MGWFKTSSTGVALALGALAGCAALTWAETFDFTFSGSGVSVLDGMLVLSGGEVTSVSGTLSGVSPSADDGTISIVLPNSGNYYNSAADYAFYFLANTSGGGMTSI